MIRRNLYCKACGKKIDKDHFITLPRFIIDAEGAAMPRPADLICRSWWCEKEGLKKLVPITTKRIIHNNKVTARDIKAWETILPNLFPRWVGNC